MLFFFDKMEINEKELEILEILDQAPTQNKKIHYVCAKTSRSFNTIYHKVKVLGEKGALIKHKNKSNEIFYIPIPDIMKKIYSQAYGENEQEEK
jgi:Fe2+ or Zn2+ uptake regulation protein